jgi:hypothetical protein
LFDISLVPKPQPQLRKLGKDIAFAKDLVLLASDFNIASAVTTVDHLIADNHTQLATIAVVKQSTRTNSYDLASLRLFLCGIWQNDTARSHLFCFEWLNHNAIIEWTQIDFRHFKSP